MDQREIDNGSIVFDTREREFVPNVELYEVVWGCAHKFVYEQNPETGVGGFNCVILPPCEGLITITNLGEEEDSAARKEYEDLLNMDTSKMSPRALLNRQNRMWKVSPTFFVPFKKDAVTYDLSSLDWKHAQRITDCYFAWEEDECKDIYVQLIKASNEVILNSHINVPEFQNEDDIENYFDGLPVIDELIILNSTLMALRKNSVGGTNVGKTNVGGTNV